MSDVRNILLVEDEIVIALVEKRLLERAGYRVSHVLNGEAAIEMVCTKNEPVDLILMDINLESGMDGTQAARQILLTHDVPIVFLSAHTEKEVVEKVEQITSYGYIVKDSGPTVLLASIKMAFKLHKAHMRLCESEDRYRTLVEFSPNGILLQHGGKIEYVNVATLKLLHAGRPDDLIGLPVSGIIHPDYHSTILAEILRSEENQLPPSTVEAKLIALDGKLIDADVTATTILYDGRLITQVIIRDITERKKAEDEREALLVEVTATRDEVTKAKDQLGAILERVSDGFVALDKDFNYIYVNTRGGELLGRKVDDLIGKNYWIEYPEARGTPFANAYIHSMETQQPIVFEDYYVHWDRWFGNRIYPSKDGITIFFNDVTERKQVENQLRQAEAKYRGIFENAIEGIFQSAPDGRFISVNAAMARIFGYETPEDMITSIGNNIATRIYANPEHRANFIRSLEQTGAVKEFEAENRRKDGSVIWTRTSARRICDSEGTVLYFEGFLEDVTRRKQAEEGLQSTNALLQSQLDEIRTLQETLRHEAVRDALTGLYNRRYLFETLDRELARAKREKYAVSVMMVDIDHFKDFNDTYGHQAGDEVLKKLGELFRSQIRQSDIACRYGGEEFVIVMPGVDNGDTKRRADMLRCAFSEMPISWTGKELFATISIGVAFCPRHGEDANEVIKAADHALYEAKRTGRNRVCIWENRL